jgi:hypothetical protein
MHERGRSVVQRVRVGCDTSILNKSGVWTRADLRTVRITRVEGRDGRENGCHRQPRVWVVRVGRGRRERVPQGVLAPGIRGGRGGRGGGGERVVQMLDGHGFVD